MSKSDRPVCIILGAMKAGTTSLFQYLTQHPHIAPAWVKEPAFFALDPAWGADPARYFALWPETPPGRMALEASTDYTKRPFIPLVPEKMAAMPGVRFKFIYLMRHPLRRLESQARHAARIGAELGLMFEPHRDFSLDAGLSERGILMSHYAYQLDAYRARFPQADILPLVFEDMKADPQATLNRVCDFLGLARFTAADFASHNRAEDRKRLPRALDTLAHLGPTRWLATHLTSREMRARVRQRFGHDIQGRFALHAEEEAALLDLLAPDLRRLRDTYGVDPARAWGIDPDRLDETRVPARLRPLRRTDAVDRLAELPDMDHALGG